MNTRPAFSTSRILLFLVILCLVYGLLGPLPPQTQQALLAVLAPIWMMALVFAPSHVRSPLHLAAACLLSLAGSAKIGRASCRERG